MATFDCSVIILIVSNSLLQLLVQQNISKLGASKLKC